MKRVLSIVTVLVLAVSASAQPQQPKNVKVLTTLTPSQLIRVMQFFNASLGVNCDFCHVRNGNDFNFPADDKDEKRTARNMIQLTIDTNQKYFNARTAVSCNTCHRGAAHPVALPALPVAAAAPNTHSESRPAIPSRDEIVAKYTAALGKIDQKALSSIELTGVRESSRGNAPIHVSIANGKTRVAATTPDGEVLNVFGPDSGWTSDAKGSHALNASELAGWQQLLEALRPVLPGEIAADARPGRDRINDKDVWVLSMPWGTTDRQRLYFDPQSGLLVRRQMLTASPVGNIPQQTDFDDYREVNGMKIPFVVRYESVDTRSSATRRYNEIKLNAKIDPKIFDMP